MCCKRNGQNKRRQSEGREKSYYQCDGTTFLIQLSEIDLNMILLIISRRFHLAPGLVESVQVLDVLETARMLCRPAFYGLHGLQKVASRRWSRRCCFEKNTARLRCMARLAERHLMHVVLKNIARIL